jgi:hypothetical protein
MSSLCVALLVGFAPAQERIPDEEALRIAKLLIEQAGKEANLAFKMEADADKPFGLKGGEAGAMIIPNKKLTADDIAKAGKDVTPIGHLWFKKVAPIVDGKTATGDKVRSITVNADGQDHQVTLYLVGVRKKDKLELVFFGKDKEPIFTTPLTQTDSKQDSPIEFEAKKTGEKMADVTFRVLGKYEAKLAVAAEE